MFLCQNLSRGLACVCEPFSEEVGGKKSCFACFYFSSFLALIKYIRPVFVSRSDQDSRRKTVEEIKRRAQSGKWPQVLYNTTVCQVIFGIVMLSICSWLLFPFRML